MVERCRACPVPCPVPTRGEGVRQSPSAHHELAEGKQSSPIRGILEESVTPSTREPVLSLTQERRRISGWRRGNIGSSISCHSGVGQNPATTVFASHPLRAEAWQSLTNCHSGAKRMNIRVEAWPSVPLSLRAKGSNPFPSMFLSLEGRGVEPAPYLIRGEGEYKNPSCHSLLSCCLLF